ncbi:hypothetical protein O181_003491 [Austropuccinia psidii MF-1]|uniref:Uncharacterized protein n=1 Tax=Austropuccinia psidii MF-1 TaxID=1389203 RepID=A0A9Q3BF25_9BASI|nr:hypothetical protein [Austropuccinia psidii MF-1]
MKTLTREGSQDQGESSHNPGYTEEMDPERAYSDSFMLTRSRPNQLSSGFTPLRIHKKSSQEFPFFTIPGSFQEKTRTKGQEKYYFQPEEERIRPNDPEIVGLSEIGAQKQQKIVNTPDRISTPTM